MKLGHFNNRRRGVVTLLAVTALAGCTTPRGGAPKEGTAPDALTAGFLTPPAESRPRAWWHWMNGNVTQDGIAKDLAWMQRVGLGGFHHFDAALSTPTVVNPRVVYMSPEWKAAFRFSADLANKLGLEMGIAASPGWSETGGPWVEPQDAMKKIAWSELDIAGGRPFTGALPMPPDTTGAYQTIGVPVPPVGQKPKQVPSFYRDSKVFAFPTAPTPAMPAARFLDVQGNPVADAGKLTDADLSSAVVLAKGTNGQPPALVIEYPGETTVQSARLYIPNSANMFFGSALKPQLEASTDGKTWRRIGAIPVTAVPTTISFAPVRARWFRVVVQAGAGNPFMGGGGPPRIADLRLSSAPRINSAEIKAGYYQTPDFYALDADVGPDVAGIDPSRVVDLTDRFRDGRLDWTPPPGNWRVVRMGYSLVGTMNHPAPPEATGLEVDKYDAEAVRRYITTYLDKYSAAAGHDLFGAKGVRALLTDSTEVGPSNWSPRVLEHFRRLRGYDPMPFLPALVGEIVGSRKQSDAFLYDYRRTLAELMATEHYGTIAKVAHERGLFLYGEALEAGRPVLGDDIEMRRFADIPMAALWTWDRNEAGTRPALIADAKGASSVAHFYGKPLAAAESMTSVNKPWAHSPNDLKRVVDLEFALGINRIVIHTSVHQPIDDKVPGFSLMSFGQFFNRHETWAEMAKPWIDYIARSSFMLQQGRNFADVAYFYGEEASPTGLFQMAQVKDAPVSYAFDYVGAEGLVNDMTVESGMLTSKHGARYSALYLGGSSRRMTLPVLRQLARLVEGGATVIGLKPTGTPGMADSVDAFAALTDRLWKDSVTRVGTGRVIATGQVEAGLAQAGMTPDFVYRSDNDDAEVLFVHRRIDGGDSYFLTNRKNRTERLEARFRVIGKAPEIWHADTGRFEPLSYRIEGGQTIVRLDMLPEDAFFVVFRTASDAKERTVVAPVVDSKIDLDSTWTVRFQTGRGAPEQISLARLAPLNEHAEPAVRYFSGTASYSRSFTLPVALKAGERVFLDLGKVGDVAEVRVNGVLVGTAWKAPYRIDITRALRRRKNQLEVRVANLWVNRLIGDAQPDAKKVTFTTIHTYGANASLRAAGLIGPVAVTVER